MMDGVIDRRPRFIINCWIYTPHLRQWKYNIIYGIAGIIIETTGLADPAPVAQTFFVDEEISKLVRLDAIITVVDSKHIGSKLNEVKPEGVENESVEQVAFADKIILNKMDLVTPEEAAAVKSQLRGINKEVEIIEATNSKVSPDLLFGINGFSLEKVLAKEPDFLDEGKEHQHDLSVTSVSFQCDEPLNVGHLQDWIQKLMKTKAANLYRYKGVMNVKGMDKKFVFQG